MLSLYCLAFADIEALVQKYFVNTVRTMMGCVNVLSGEHGLLSIIHREMYTVVLWIGVAWFSYKNKRYAWILLCYMWFRLCFGGTVRQYYFTILTPFALFFPIVTLPYVVNRLPLLQRYIPVCCVLSAMVALVNLRYINRIYRNAAEDRVEYYKALYVMAQVEKPNPTFTPPRPKSRLCGLLAHHPGGSCVLQIFTLMNGAGRMPRAR